MAYLIQRATLTAIADQVRRLTGTNVPLSPAQMATALSAGAFGDNDYDSFRFYDFENGLSGLGNNGYDDDGNALTPLTALPYLDKYTIGPARSAHESAILSRFNPVVSGHSGAANKNILAEIRMPKCLSISDYYYDSFSSCINLVSAWLPACTSVGGYAFEFCYRLEELTLNSACVISEYAFAGVVQPDSGKIFRLYLRGDTMGSCSDRFEIDPTGGSNWQDAQDLYSGEIPGLEIYVPPALLNDFKTTWANGYFADNIFPLTD